MIRYWWWIKRRRAKQGGGSPPESHAGEPIGLLLLLTKAE
jgi:hypothetical protein